MFKFLNVMMISITLSFCHVNLASALSDKTPPQDIFEYYKNEETNVFVVIYFRALGSGLSWASGDLSNSSSELFCPPAQISFSGEDYYSIYKQGYFHQKEIWDSFDFQPPGLILLEELKRIYPCN